MSLFTNWCSFFVINSAWQLLVLIGIASLLVRFLPKISNALEHCVWVSCLLLSVTVPCISTYLAVVPVHTVAATARVPEGSRWKIPRSPEHGRLTQPLTAVETTQVEVNTFQVIAAIYSASLFSGLLVLLLRIVKTRRIVKSRSVLAVRPSVPEHLDHAFEKSRRSIDVFLSSELKSPATVNWPGPIILVPKAFESMGAVERATVIAHEIAHVERRDFHKNLLMEVVSLSLCYHPMMWWLKRRIAASREAICDEIAAVGTSVPGHINKERRSPELPLSYAPAYRPGRITRCAPEPLLMGAYMLTRQNLNYRTYRLAGPSQVQLTPMARSKSKTRYVTAIARSVLKSA